MLESWVNIEVENLNSICINSVYGMILYLCRCTMYILCLFYFVPKVIYFDKSSIFWHWSNLSDWWEKINLVPKKKKSSYGFTPLGVRSGWSIVSWDLHNSHIMTSTCCMRVLKFCRLDFCLLFSALSSV